MNPYADEKFYKEQFLCGKKAALTEGFAYYARDATQKIKRYTGDNIDGDNVPECVKMCCCEVAELTFGYEKSLGDTGGRSSESVGGWSVSYESREQSARAHAERVRDCVYKWLGGTGLLYRGLR